MSFRHRRAPARGPALKRLVLAGAGHAHALVLLDFARGPPPGVELVLVSPQAQAPYSGMVPGWLAGAYRFDEIVVDLPALCAAAGARWVEGELHALDPARRRLQLADGRELAWDLLSLNVGSTLEPPADAGAPGLAMRPLGALREGVDALLARWAADPSDRPFTLTALGGGAAGFESLLALLARLRALRPDRPVHGGLVTRGSTVLPELSAPARRAALAALQRAGVTVQLGAGGCATRGAGSDLLLWATGAQAHAWQRDPARRGGLAVDAQGFVQVDEQLRSPSHPAVFAAGDGAGWQPPLPKAGVHAVRMGPVLAHNLRAALAGTALRAHRPQRHFLKLLATGDGRAIASRGPFGAEGRWVWWWKDHIDRGFLRRFAGVRPG